MRSSRDYVSVRTMHNTNVCENGAKSNLADIRQMPYHDWNRKIAS